MSSCKIQRSFVLPAVFFLLACWQNASSLAAQTNAQGHSLRIGVFIQDNAGKPISDLSARDFTLSSHSVHFSFKLVRPVLGSKPPAGAYEPTWMLILLSPHIADSISTLNSLLPALNPLWQRRWQIAAVLNNGSKTDYATSAGQLQQMWTAARPSTTSKLGSERAAVKNLESFAGRRVVLYLVSSTNRETTPPQQIIATAKEAMAPILIVDGGVRMESRGSDASYSGGGVSSPIGGVGSHNAARVAQEAEPSSSANPPAPTVPIIRKVNQYDSNVFHAIDARAAIREAMRTAQGYYGLRIQNASLQTLPPGTALSIRIRLFDVPDYTATVIAYGKNPPQILLIRK